MLQKYSNFVTIQDFSCPNIRISNTSCSFAPFAKVKNAHMGRGSPIRTKFLRDVIALRNFFALLSLGQYFLVTQNELLTKKY